MLSTCTIISVDDGLLKTSTGCAGPSSSSTLYVVCSNVTVTATGENFHYDKETVYSTNFQIGTGVLCKKL